MDADEKSANLLALSVIFQRERVSHSQAILELEVFLLANSATFSASLLVYFPRSMAFGSGICSALLAFPCLIGRIDDGVRHTGANMTEE